MRNRTAARTAALLLCVVWGGTVPVLAAPIGDGVLPVCDEAYYATTDYYGNLTNGSVVKSYLLNGAESITDYGSYDEVTNLTDGSSPAENTGRVTFRFGQDAPARFYFEGKTEQPFRDLPWTLSVQYSLNGVPARADELGGKTGVVQIDIDAVPNAAASAYARNNYVLAATAVFNQDDILSLEAPGAQLQLIGNLRTALFMAFPGEEQHFMLRVGTENFSFGGLTFMMVPATLSQLDEIAKISEKKTDLEDSYHDLSDSLDDVLDAFRKMQSSLYETADGLDTLDKARETVANGKGGVYGDLDDLRKDLNELEKALNPLAGNARDMRDFVTGSIGAVNVLVDGTLELQGDLKGLEDLLADLQTGLAAMEAGLETVEAALDPVGTGLDAFADGLRDTEEKLLPVEDSLENVGDSLEAVETGLADLETGVADTEQRLSDVEDSLSDVETGMADLEDGLKKMEDGAGTVKNALNQFSGMRSDLNRLASALGNVSGLNAGTSLNFRDTLAKVELFDAAYTAADFETFLADMLYIGGNADTPETAAAMAAQMAPLAAVPALPEDNENYAAWVSVRQMAALYQGIQAGMTFERFVATVLSQQEAYAEQADKLAAQMAYLNRARKSSHAPALDILLDSMETVMEDVEDVTASANSALRGIAAPTAAVVRDLANLCGRLDGLSGTVDDAADLSKTLRGTSADLRDALDTARNASTSLRETLRVLRDMSADVRAASGTLRETLDTVSDASEALRGTLTAFADTLAALHGTLDAVTETSTAARGVSATARAGMEKLRSTSGTVRSVLDDLDALRGVLNAYEPKLRDTLTTLEKLSQSAASAVRDSNQLLDNTESLARTAGEQLNTGTEQTLGGLSSTLRSAAEGLDTTSQVQNAKNTITDLIEDTWDEYTGDVNNLLLMDAQAEAQSLTSDRNPAPQSVQVLIRTQEIEVPDTDDVQQTSAAGTAERKPTTFLGRIGQMFRDFWNAVTGIFR